MRGWEKGITLLALLAVPVSCAATPPPDAVRIEALVQQLGSVQYAEREAARKALDAIGVAALDSLRKAARTGDLELKNRAQKLCAAIEKRTETAEVLTPTSVRLNYKNTPIMEAVRDINRQYAKSTGFPDPIVIWGVGKERTITLTHPPTSFWEALDVFCEKAELTHVIGASVFENALNTPGQPLTSSDSIGHFQVVLVDNKHLTGSKELAMHKPSSAATCYAGSVRLRAYPRSGATPQKGQAILTLEIVPEPKIRGWYQQIEGSMTVKFDDHTPPFSQTLALEKIAEPNLLGYHSPPDPPGRGEGLRLAELPLAIPDKHGKTVSSLKGTVLVKVESAPYPLLTVENILKAVDKTFPVKGDKKITIKSVNHSSAGNLVIDLSLPVWSSSGVGISETGINVSLDRDAFVFQLFDNQGNVVPPSKRPTWSGSLQTSFQLAGKGAVPSKMTIRGSHVTTIEVPFEFKDVPLP